MADAISDIVCDEDSFLDGFAHKGILNGARLELSSYIWLGQILIQAIFNDWTKNLMFCRIIEWQATAFYKKSINFLASINLIKKWFLLHLRFILDLSESDVL